MLKKALLFMGTGDGSAKPVPYSRFSFTVSEISGTNVVGFIESDHESDESIGAYTHLEGTPLYVNQSGVRAAFFMSTSSSSFISIPLADGGASGVCTVFNETTGKILYGVYSPFVNSGIVDADMVVLFTSYADALQVLNDPSTFPENTDVPFSANDVGETLTFSIYKGKVTPSVPIEPYSRLDVTCGNSGTMYGCDQEANSSYGSYSVVSGVDFKVSYDGSEHFFALSNPAINFFTFALPSEGAKGVCTILNETTGDIFYGGYGTGLLAGNGQDLVATFASAEDAMAFVENGSSALKTDAPLIFNAGNLGKTIRLSFYLGDVADDLTGGAPEWTPPIPTGTYSLQFKVDSASENVNIFKNVDSKAHDAKNFSVEINGVATEQVFTSLSFTSGDVVKITGTNVISFPQIYMFNKRFVSEYQSALPFMSDRDGNGVIDFGSAFRNASGQFPSDFLYNNPQIQNFYYTFQGIRQIPLGFLDKSTEAKSFINAFSYGNFSSIPTGLFDACAKAEDFSYAFTTNYSLTTIPSGLFANNKESLRFVGVFDSTVVNNVPENTFEGCSKATDFSVAFKSCKMTTLPNGLFATCSSAESFKETFSYCSSLTTIPSGLFSSNTKVKSFEKVFYYCDNLGAIPSGLFSNNSEVTTFEYAFYGCKKITVVPNGLFDRCANVTNFYGTFKDCNALTSIPENLFADNTEVTDFSRTFENCTSLTGRIKIGSAKVTRAYNFCNNTGAITVIVPAGSTTETTFRNVAQTLTNLTVETF